MYAITLIEGDGVGPEVVQATQRIVDATGVKITWETFEAGSVSFQKGCSTGVPIDTLDSIVKNKVVLKGPLATPIGFGEKSANVTLRKLFDTFGNIRPIREIPGVTTPYSGRGIDLTIVRENVEDLYAGIEYMQTLETAQCLKLISRPGCERIAHLAFEYGKLEGKRTIHCATKANIMKMSEGMLKRAFEEISKDYPDLKADHIVVDNCAHQLVKKPEQFDVIVTTNMNGDILSDLSSALIGGLGFAPSVNMGRDVFIFEAVHGSAPKYTGQNCINPSAMILSSVMMLRFLGEGEAAYRIEQALFQTTREGILTRDVSPSPVTTTAFTDAVIRRLEFQDPKTLSTLKFPHHPYVSQKRERDFVGIDVFIETNTFKESVQRLQKTYGDLLSSISDRGVVVYPQKVSIPKDIGAHLRCRFFFPDDIRISEVLNNMPYPWMHVEKLFKDSDGACLFSLDHG